MKRLIATALFLAAIAAIDYGIERAISQQTEPPVVYYSTNNPVFALMTMPTNGAVVSNTIMVSAIAAAFPSPVVKVEFYRDGVLFKTVWRTPSPGNLEVRK